MQPILTAIRPSHFSDLIHEVVYGFKQPVCQTQRLEDALEAIRTQQFEVVLWEQRLQPDKKLDVVQELRTQSYQTRVMVFGEEDGLAQRLTALRHGADEYLPRVCHLEEVKLRLQHLLNISKTAQYSGFEITGLQVFPDTQTITDGTNIFILRQREFQIFVHFCRHKNTVVSRQQLERFLWPNEQLHRSTVHSYVNRIRKTLPNYDQYLKTISGVGYMLCEGTPSTHYSVSQVMSHSWRHGALYGRQNSVIK